ncbi:cytochrome b2 [Diaporthe helianthi]|uniref:L-lactate dehydrogenase (cytochrome) n=1 Tax=Diaporthe helianthi TaxID=158607 RepID=A0A2P5HNS0_DIAHE|nr:cytochrome b2 [Diaporthe helianthi]
MEQTNETQISATELGKHNTRENCWVAVHSKVWDLTNFIDEHPGGAKILLSVAGKNATSEFDQVHAPGIIEESLPADKFKGAFHEASSDVPTQGAIEEVRESRDSKNQEISSDQSIPALQSLLSAADIEEAASKRLTRKTWAFYSSAATDLVTHHLNKAFLRRIMIKPRILRNVTHTDQTPSILGHKSSAPFFISPAAMARLAHKDGELALARAAGQEGIIQCISNNASYPLSSIVDSGQDKQPFFFQLYVNSERQKTTEILQKARRLGIKAIFVTVDAPVPGKREADERLASESAVQSAVSGATSSKDKKGAGLGRLMAQYIDKSLTWSDLAWIRKESGLPIVLKGVQSVEDPKLAVEFGMDGILLSNHGGRSLDTAQPAILNLLELRLKCPEIFSKLEVYVDGRFERGTDIIKAIALGATAVGVGRPLLYSLVYGQAGAEHLIQILKDEIEVSMKLAGLTDLDQAGPELLNTADIDHLIRSSRVFPALKGFPWTARL